MRIKRIVSTLMTVVLLFGCLCFAGAAQAAEETTPKVVVSAVNVTKNGEPDGDLTGYLELSLLVQAKEFQTVGVVLSYDTAVLTPVDWSSTAANPLNPTDSWTTVIPTKGADDAAGKPALAKLAEPVTEGGPVTRAYLYLGASSLQYQDLSEAATRLVTVRFKITSDGGTGYLPVTVPGAGAGGAALTNESFTICLAPEAVANDAIPGAQTMLTLGEKLEAGADLNTETEILNGYALKYYAWRSTVADYVEKGETACEVSFETANGPSVNTGTVSSVTGGAYAITFFDWDGRVIDAISAGGEADSGTTKVTAEQLAMIENIEAGIAGSKPGYEFENWLVVYQTNDGSGLQTVNGSLTARKAHDSSSKPAMADIADFTTAHLTEINTAYLHEHSGVANSENGGAYSVLVQAQYKTTDEVNGGWHDASGNRVPNPADTTGLQRGEDYDLSMPDSYYTIGEPTFYQSGSTDGKTGYYIITCTLDRGVALRSNELAIKGTIVMINQNKQEENVVVRVDPELTDHSKFQIVVPRSATKVYYQALETYQRPGWTAAPIRSAESAQIPIATIIEKGAVSLLLSEAETAFGKYTDGMTADNMKNIWSSDVNAQCFKDAKYSAVTNANLYVMELRIMKWMKANGKTSITQGDLSAALTSGL